MQQTMVLASLRAPSSGVYVLQRICECSDRLNLGLLQRSWKQVAWRHPALRTSIQINGSDAWSQRCDPDPEISWREMEWPATDPGRLSAFLREDSERGFGFEDGPPLRFSLIQTERGSILIWTVHHALLDGRSILIVWRELFAIYDTLSGDAEATLTAPADFAIHLDWLQQQDFSQSAPFWRRQWEGVTETTGYVIDRIRSACPSTEAGYAKALVQLDKNLTEHLTNFAATHENTLNTVILGAWALLLSRYAGRTDVVFGVTRDCRHSSVPRAEDMVGLFINTLPFHISVAPETPLLVWLRKIRAQWIEMREYEQTPLNAILRWIGLPPGTPPFDSIVVYEHEPASETLRKLEGNWVRRGVRSAERTDSSLTLVAYGKPLVTLQLVFDTRLFSQETVVGMLGHLRTLLESFVANPRGNIGEIRMLSFQEEESLTDYRTRGSYSLAFCAHHLFEQQAARTPDKAALEHAGQTISYSRLNERANKLANFLLARGIGAGHFVAIGLDRSPEVVSAVLAVLKTGAAFVPLDLALPADRRAAMLADASPSYILNRAELEAFEEQIDRQTCENLDVTVSPADPAYAIYTSGSAGNPKAVVVNHRGLVNHTLAVTQAQGTSAEDRRLQFISFGSDVFLAEVFNYLSTGATLVFAHERATSVGDFLRLLDDHRITVTGMPSGWWHEWVAALASSHGTFPKYLRLVIAGMERVNASAYADWKRIVGARVRWINAYGPTETTITSLSYEGGSSKWELGPLVPIGRPIANMRAYVLDGARKLLPNGISGELYIAGPGVASGYLNAPDLTAGRFVPDPFSSEPDSRLYRTGDLAFRLPDGNFVFLGRDDRQVKIRGYRVELDEIEAALFQGQGVRQAAVTVGENQNLTAFLTVVQPGTDDGGAPDVALLRRHLSRHLPPYMIPREFVVLRCMPLTPSGKIDYRSLQSYNSFANPIREVGAQSTETERRLAPLWQQALSAGPSGPDDDFFLVGGDSLCAAALIRLIAVEFGQEISLSSLLRAPTFAMLARYLGSASADFPQAHILQLRTTGDRIPIFAISPGPGDASCFTELAAHLPPDQPFFALNNPIAGEKFEPVEELAGRVCGMIRSTQPRGPYIVGGYCFGGLLAFEAARQLLSAGESVHLIALFDTPAPGYPKVPGANAYWRQLRLGIGGAEALTHVRFVGRLLATRALTTVRRALTRTVRFEPSQHGASLSELIANSARAYVPKQIHVPVAQFIGQDQPLSSRVLEDPRLGWKDVSMDEFHLRYVPGTHSDRFQLGASEVASKLDELLAARRAPAIS